MGYKASNVYRITFFFGDKKKHKQREFIGDNIEAAISNFRKTYGRNVPIVKVEIMATDAIIEAAD